MKELKYVIRILTILHKISPEMAEEYAAKIPAAVNNMQVHQLWEQLRSYIEDSPEIEAVWAETAKATNFEELGV